MQRFGSHFFLCALLCAALALTLRAQTAPVIRSDEEDAKKFLPPQEVVHWGIGVYGGVRGSVNTTALNDKPTYTPTFTFIGTTGFSIDVFPQADFGISLYAPMLFAEKLGINLDIGLSTYSFGTQMWNRFILTIGASKKSGHRPS